MSWVPLLSKTVDLAHTTLILANPIFLIVSTAHRESIVQEAVVKHQLEIVKLATTAQASLLLQNKK